MPDRKARPSTATEESEQEVSARGRSFWSGVITFGLVSVPVELWPAVRRVRPGLRMLDPTGQPLARRWFSSKSGKALSPDDIVRGFEIDQDRFVVITDEELEAIAPDKSREIDLRRFVDVDALPPLLFERAWFLTPAEAGSKAYRLLAATMEENRKAGIATFVMRGKEYLIAILAENGFLRAETLRFQDEVRTPADIGLGNGTKVPARLLQSLEKKVAALTKKSLAKAELRDVDTESLLGLVESKRRRGDDVVEAAIATDDEDEGAAPIDLMDLLKRSLEDDAAGPREKATSKRRSGGGRSARRGSPPKRSSGAKKPAPASTRLSREELYARAQKLDIPGRSRMSKEDLAKAIAAGA